MKLLYLYNLYQQSGGENMWVQSEPELFRERGHEVVIHRRDNKEIQDFSTWRKASLFWQARWSQESYDAVRALIRRERPDVAHVYNTLVLLTPSVYYACRDEGVPVVQTVYNYRLLCPAGTFLRDGTICEQCVEHSLMRSVVHGCYRESRMQSAALAWTLRSHRQRGTWSDVVDLYLTPTEFMRHKLIEGGLPAAKIVVKPNFHDPDPGLREASDGSALYIGRLTPEKGVRTLLAAWQMMGHSHAPKLRIMGDGPLRDEVEGAARNPESMIEFLGPRPHHEVIARIKKAAFLVLPSEWYEAFPHVILEAFACGIPIIASEIGTLADIIQHKKTGVLFQPGNAEDLATKVKWVVAHEDEAARLGMAGRVQYEAQYTAERNYQRLLGIYRGLVETSGTKPLLEPDRVPA
jgi:glycosyltransferase involved in cell wall biosynthesis